MAERSEEPLSAEDFEAARQALERNQPDVTRDTPKYHALLQGLAAMHQYLGANRFKLNYNLRPTRDKIEDWSRDYFQGRLTKDELRSRLKSDAERPIDVEMLRTFCDGCQKKLEHYSAILQTVIRVVHDQQNSDAWIEGEATIDTHVAAMNEKFPLWSENLETVIEFLEELRAKKTLGLVKLGQFEGTSAHWLAQIVLNRTAEAWVSCKAIATRSRTDPRYIYAVTASQLFFDNWYPLLPQPQQLSERLREEFVLARMALKEGDAKSRFQAVGKQEMSKNAAGIAPKAFISYSWDSAAHKEWSKELAARLRRNGVDVTLDQWSTVPGDQLPKFMETAIRENSYVLVICTPSYKKRSDGRKGGVGYEGDIMTGEVLSEQNDRKFIPVLRTGTRSASTPAWLTGKYDIDLSDSPYSEEAYLDLLTTLHNQREQAPPIGRAPEFRKSVRNDARKFYRIEERIDAKFEPIKIEGVLANEAGRPRNDGTPGSALYGIPFRLNRAPTHEWSELFIKTWDHPPQFSTRHRPGIARVQGDRIVLTQTTIEEVKEVHREMLKLVVDTVNAEIAESVRKRQAGENSKALQEQQHRDKVRKIADELSFD